MLEIKKSMVVNKSFYIQSLATTVGDIYLNYVSKAHLLENNEISLEGIESLGGQNFNLLSEQKKIIEKNLNLNRSFKGSIDATNHNNKSIEYCENSLALLNLIEKKLIK